MEVEDDVLFAELSRQLALLIMDDDEQFPVQPPPPLPFPVSLLNLFQLARLESNTCVFNLT